MSSRHTSEACCGGRRSFAGRAARMISSSSMVLVSLFAVLICSTLGSGEIVSPLASASTVLGIDEKCDGSVLAVVMGALRHSL